MVNFRRTDPRYERRLDVELQHEGRRLQVVSRNISLGGIFVESDELVPHGATVELRFRVPTQPETIEVTGEVRWIEKRAPGTGAGIGIRFHGLRARDVWALNRFFQG